MSNAPSARAGLKSLFAAMLPPEPPATVAVDPAALAAEAYLDGVAAGTSAAEERLRPLRDLLTATIGAFEVASVIDPAALRNSFITLVTTLAQTVVAAELRLDPAVMVRLVETALAAVGAREDVVVRVHPDDAACLAIAIPLTIVSDPAFPRGTVVVDGPTLVVRDGLDLRLAALIEEVA